MNGVEILSVKEVVSEYAFNANVFWIAFFIILGLVVATGILTSMYFKDWSFLWQFAVFGVFLAGAGGDGIAKDLGIPVKYENQYKVVISDEASMNEFLDKYEIIEREGKIYMVREREGD